MPVAMNGWVAPTAIETFAGVIMIESKVGWVTVSKVEPLTDPEVAVMVDDPTAVPLASPETEIVAVVELVVAHATVAVRFVVLPSL